MTVRPLVLDDIPSAAALLVGRHASHRVKQPLLGPLDQVAAERAVTALLCVEGARGAVAVQGGVVVGYLVGTSKPGAAWGANVWVEPAGCAGQQLLELWAWLAADWVTEGLDAHYAVVPPALVGTFFSLGFGLQQVHAVKAVAPVALDPRVRPAERRDIPVLAQLDVLLDAHLVSSPVFSGLTPTDLDAAVAEWESDFDDPAYAVFVAEVDGITVGSAVACDIAKSSGNSGLIAPPSAALLGFAAVLPSHRGLGLSAGLDAAAVDWATSEGYPVIASDWRATNLEAARAWTARGYAQTFVRLHRLVGH
jgi:GNAT superfamily N-acetyltransferase